jgi:hypothetical protein
MGYRPIRTYEEVPFPLYKYTKLEHAKDFFLNGILRLNTLFEYVENETYTDGTQDYFEGFYLWHVNEEDRQNKDVPEMRMILARNQLTFCITEDLTPSLLKEFDADCCIVIHSPIFFQELDIQLSEQFRNTYLRKVTYFDKTNLGAHPKYEDFGGVMKHIKYAHQKEFRALWEPTKPHFAAKLTEEDSLEFLGWDSMQDSLVKYLPQEEYFEYIKREQEWLKPKFIKVPAASSFCSLLLPTPAGRSKPFDHIPYDRIREFFA